MIYDVKTPLFRSFLSQNGGAQGPNMDVPKDQSDYFLMTNCLDQCMIAGYYDEAIEFIEIEFNSVVDDLEMHKRCHIYEYLALSYMNRSKDGDRDNAIRAISQILALQKDYRFRHSASYLIYGHELFLLRNVDAALNVFRKGLSQFAAFSQTKANFESCIAAINDAKAANEAETARQKRVKELIEDEEREKKVTEDKLREKKEKEGRKKRTRSREENIKGSEESDRCLPSLRDMVKSMITTKKLVTMLVDLFATDVLDVAIEFKLSPYIFYPSTAMALSLFLYLPKLDEETSCEYRDLPGPVQIPGCIPVHGRDLLDPVQDRKNDAYKWVLHHAKKYRLAEGIMVNSFKDLEEGAIKALQELGCPPVYPVGPLIQMDHSSIAADGLECLRWLDDQPHGSVLFISFGSGGTLSSNQITELALGLEMSEQRFLWVVRSPDDESANASFFNIQSKNDPIDFLPQGFIERTKSHGLVVPNWAPQAQILSHGSTGGFLSHCGWNSVLETVVNDVPLIAWPLYAEQKMNAVMLTEGIKVALRPQVTENGLVGRVEIVTVVKRLMEGEEGKRLRTRMRDLKDAASNALSDDGSSTKAIAQVASKWSS